MIRSILFNVTYWIISILYVFLAAISLIAPGHHVTSWIVKRYAHRMVQALRYLAGIKLNVTGKENAPAQCIIAAKHHSWFDGFCMYDQFADPLAFVTGDHLEKIPLLSGVLRKLGAIVVNNCGGHEARKALADSAAKAASKGRRILIYPEGHLSAPGTYHKYRTGVWHMYRDFKLPVVPVATNLGCFAQQQEFRKKAGTATLEFMPAIPYDEAMTKDEFMARLSQTIEGRSNQLIADVTGGNVVESVIAQPKVTTKEAVKNLGKMS